MFRPIPTSAGFRRIPRRVTISVILILALVVSLVLLFGLERDRLLLQRLTEEPAAPASPAARRARRKFFRPWRSYAPITPNSPLRTADRPRVTCCLSRQRQDRSSPGMPQAPQVFLLTVL